MAQVTSGSFETNKYQGSTGQKGLKLEWSRTSTSIDSNYSRIHWVWKGAGTGSTYHELRNSYLNINGTRVYTQPSGKINLYVGTKVAEGDIDIPHNADGTKTFSADGGGGVYTSAVNCTGSGSWELETIPRASTFSISGGTLNQTITISISRASSSFTHRVYCVLGNTTQTFSNSATTSASGTLSLDFANEITNSTTATATMCVETYNNGTYIGSNSSQFTITVPSSIVPTISSVTKTDTANYLSTYGAYVQGKSNLRVQTSSNGSYGSSINSTVVNIKSGNSTLRTLSGSDVTLPNISYTGTLTVEVIITDSRNRTATNTSTITVASYSNPVISLFSAERLNNNSTVTVKISASITNINSSNANTKSYKLYAREKGTSSWGSALINNSSNYTYTNNSYTVTKDENKSWEFKLDVKDAFTTTTQIVEVGTVFELTNYGSNGTTIAFGKVADTNKSNAFECELDMYAKKIYMYDSTSMTYVPIEIEIVDTW